jgi:ABC-type molybdate transport system permease subunit
MDWQALYLSLQLASLTVLILIPFGILMAQLFL